MRLGGDFRGTTNNVGFMFREHVEKLDVPKTCKQHNIVYSKTFEERHKPCSFHENFGDDRE